MRMLMLLAWSVLTIGVYSVGSTGEAAASPDAVYFEGARLIVGDGSAPIEDAAFVVEQGRLTRIGARGSVQAPEGATRASLSGKTVMPMLIDLHVHIGFLKDGVFAGEHYTRENIIDQLNRAEFYGVSAVLSLGTDLGVEARQIREDQPAGKLGGATLFIAGRGFVVPGGGPTVSSLEHVPFEVDRPELARLLVRELVAQKVDMIKVWVDDRLGTRPKLPPEMYAAIIDEAHKHGVRIMAHVYYLADAKELVRAGVDGLAHMVRDVEVDDEFVQLAKERNLFICAALSAHVKPIDAWIDDPAFAEASPPRVRERFRAGQTGLPAIPASMQAAVLLPKVHNSMRKLRAAGVRFALGDDTGIPSRFHGFNEHLELEAMVDAGLTPLEAIAAGTSVPAQILGLTDRGALSVGKSADFIVLDANPVEDITNTKRIAQVYRQGRVVDRARLSSAWQQ